MNRRRLLRRSGAAALSGFLAGCTDVIDRPSTPPNPTPCPMPEFDAIESDDYDRIEPFERAVFERVNESRKSRGLEVLEWDEVLAYISRLHSQNMAANSYVGHEDDAGRSPADRLAGFNYRCPNSYAENIYFKENLEPEIDNIHTKLAKLSVAGWRDSQEHREIMWSEAGGVAGVGCYINADNDVYVTNLFCTHDPADAEDAGTGTPPADCYYGGDPP